MSWLARSLASSLNPDQHPTDEATGESSPPSPDAEARGVKEDISELTETLTRQFWGVASFLAPPPPPPPPPPLPTIPSATARRRPDPPPADQVLKIRRDFSGSFRSGISRFSNNAAEISKIASNFLPFREEEEEEEEGEEEEEEEEEDENGKDSESTYSVSAIGLTDEVLAYARNISMHPETWLDFPLFYDYEDCDDFDMSDAQEEHALAVEHLLPRLAALRIELCPNHMTDGCFWKIYFVLLHSRLNKHDAELLSTPQIVEAKAMLLQRLQEMKLKSENANKGASYRNSDNSFASEVNSLYDFRHEFEGTQPPISPIGYAMEERRLWSTGVVNDIGDKPFVPEEPSPSVGLSIQNYVDDHEGDAWLEEESRALGESGAASIHLINEEDVSFSDLEDDDNCTMPAGYRAAIPASNMSTNYTHTKTVGSNNLFSSDDDFDKFMRL